MNLVDAIVLGMSLAERAVMTATTIRAMREEGITDEQILATLTRLDRMHEKHQALDFRTPLQQG